MDFYTRYAAYQAAIEQYLEGLFSTDKPYGRLQEAMRYSLLGGGKRIRPVLTLEMARLGGIDWHLALPYACALELVHTYSLIHDDLPCMDNDELRRGLPTTWKKFGYDMAVLAGDALMIYAFETAAKAFAITAHPDRAAKAIQVLAEKTGIYGMIGGQVVDVELTGKPIPQEKLDFIYRLKTGALLEASMMIGAILGGASEKEQKRVEEIASAVGLAFQIQDDILDVTSTAEELGKPVHSDEKNNKVTYVTLFGTEKAAEQVEELSEKAIDLLKSLNKNNEFLYLLIEKLINRRK